MKKNQSKTFGVYDRPKKPDKKPVIIAVVIVLSVILAIFLVRSVYAATEPATLEYSRHFLLQSPALSLDELQIRIDIRGALR